MGKNIVIVFLAVFALGFVTDTLFIRMMNPPDELADQAKDPYEPVVVLELYTSQGCSSCPAADRLLKQVMDEGRENVYAISYHVDYWNYIGWEDPFSKPQYAVKQKFYNTKFHNNGNYTPQLIINGREHLVGSDAGGLRNRMFEYSKQKASNAISLTDAKVAGKKISFHYNVQGEINGRHLRAILALDERTTRVTRGENRSRTLVNTHIAVAEKEVDLKGREGTAAIELPDIILEDDKVQLLVFAENEDYDITGASAIPLP